MFTMYARKALTAIAATAALCGFAAIATATPAGAQQTLYRGVDNRYSNIKLDLYLTRQRNGTIDATGSVYLAARFQYFIKGTFSGSTLTAGLTYNAAAGVPAAVGVTGTLTGGGIGGGVLNVTTGPVPTGQGIFNALSFALTPNGAPINRPAPIQFPTDVRGTAGFGYTQVTLALHLAPNGSAYLVTGTLTVHSLRPQNSTTTMQVAGTYNGSGQPVRLIVRGYPAIAPNNPILSATFTGQQANCQLTGLPSLGITNLYIVAK
ncbi:MAG TPA: hypothetical protein VKT77_10355 [Chthonomonadaceae bacterium]|nr:hypothetical protein [Chthonomonadaceae bacterium]